VHRQWQERKSRASTVQCFPNRLNRSLSVALFPILLHLVDQFFPFPGRDVHVHVRHILRDEIHRTQVQRLHGRVRPFGRERTEHQHRQRHLLHDDLQRIESPSMPGISMSIVATVRPECLRIISIPSFGRPALRCNDLDTGIRFEHQGDRLPHECRVIDDHDTVMGSVEHCSPLRIVFIVNDRETGPASSPWLMNCPTSRIMITLPSPRIVEPAIPSMVPR
jgi:hypothetical protein